MGLLWYPAKQFANYSLKLDWMMPGDDNGGVFIGFPPEGDPGRPSPPATRSRSTPPTPTDRTTGSVYSFQAADHRPRRGAEPAGQWNTYEIGVHGQRVEICLNGVEDQRLHQHQSGPRPGRHIGIQNHGTGDDVSFRNIRIKELGRHHADQRHRPDQGPGRQVPGRPQRRHRGRHPGPDLHLQRQRPHRPGRSPRTATIKALGKCLDVSGGSSANCTKIQLWTCTVTLAELVGPVRRHPAQPRPPASAWTLPGNSSADSTVVLLWTCNSSAANQKWTLPEQPTPPPTHPGPRPWGSHR